MKIVTYNVGHGRYNDQYINGSLLTKKTIKDNIIGSLKILDEINADVVLLQETGKLSLSTGYVNHDLILKNTGYYKHYQSNRHIPLLVNIGNTVLSKSKLYKYKSLKCSHRLNGYLENVFCQNKKTIKMINKEVVIYNIHLCPYKRNELVRKEQFMSIMNDAIHEYNLGKFIIIGGDFNMDLNNGISYLDPHFKLIIPQSNTNRSLSKRYTGTPDNMLDGFIISNNIKVTSIKSLNNFKYSDHTPVVLEISISQ